MKLEKFKMAIADATTPHPHQIRKQHAKLKTIKQLKSVQPKSRYVWLILQH